MSNPSTALSAPGFGRGHRLLPTSRLGASSNLALEAAAGDEEVVLVDADTYGGAVAHVNIQICRKAHRTMVAILDPEVVVRADWGKAPVRVPTVLRGAARRPSRRWRSLGVPPTGGRRWSTAPRVWSWPRARA